MVIRTIPETDVVHVDVREELRAGREPFGRIMAARREVPAGGALCVRAIFEPVPLYAVMARQGFTHHTERLAEDDWQVWFYSANAADLTDAEGSTPSPPGTESNSSAVAPAPSVGPDVDSAEEDVVVLDVRGLEPPEPMVRTLEALEALPEGHTLVQLNVRVPQFLLPQLEERGFAYEIREQSPDLVRVFIRRARRAHPILNVDDTPLPDTKTLDVRVIPPREKHPTIFRTFESLEPGVSFILVNDHDPLPLRYQFQSEHEDEFEWTYLEQGPTVWRVEIAKRVKS
jgi:uncharacterized protein (DUF2249 family)